MAGIRFALLAIVTLLSVPTGASAAIVYSTGTSTLARPIATR